MADCRKLKREKAKAGDSANKDKPEKASAKVAVAESESDEDSDTPSSKQVVRLLMASDIALSDRKLSSSWILDSGASRSMSSNRKWFSHFSSLSSPIPIALSDNSTIYGTGVGRVVVGVKVNGSWQRAILEDVLYVPELHGNLLSVAQLTRRGNAVHFTNKGCEIYLSDGTLLCKGLFHSNLYVLPIRAKPSVAARVAITELPCFPSEGNEASATAVALTARGTSKADAEIWHRRLAHLDYDAVIRMVKKGMVRGMEITGGIHPDTCEPCIKGKHMRSEISKHTETRSETILGRIFSDVCGKLPTRSHQGYEYFATFVDDKSRKVHVAGLKRKSDVAQNLKDFVACAENETGQSVKILRSDGGGEYIGSALTEYLKGKGIRQELTTADTPQHNGVAECMNKTLLDKVRSMLLDADLPELYWYGALVHAVHLHNVSPTRTLEDMTPEEAWSGNKPDVSDLRVFGSKAFVHIPDSQRTKLGAKSLLCTHLGLAQNRKAYRLVHRPTRRFFESRDVIFDEGKQIYQRVVLEQYRTPDPAPPSSTSTPEPAPTQPAATLTPVPTTQVDPDPPAVENAPATTTTFAATSRPKRKTRPPMRDDDQRYAVSSYGTRKRPDEHARVAKANSAGDPRTYADAMACPDAAEWELACENEKRAFEQMGVYEIVPRPTNRKVVGSRWVFHVKRGPDGAVQKYKARVVAQGFTQIEGIDYDETFAPSQNSHPSARSSRLLPSATLNFIKWT